MDKETKLANLQKTSKVFAVIARVIEIVNYVGAAICAAAIPVLFIAQDKLQYFVSGQESDQLFQMLSKNMEYKSAMVIFLRPCVGFVDHAQKSLSEIAFVQHGLSPPFISLYILIYHSQ